VLTAAGVVLIGVCTALVLALLDNSLNSTARNSQDGGIAVETANPAWRTSSAETAEQTDTENRDGTNEPNAAPPPDTANMGQGGFASGTLAAETFAPAPTSTPASTPVPTTSSPAANPNHTAAYPLIFNHDGFELPVHGATGYAPIQLNIRASASDTATSLATVQPGAAFLILREEGGWWEITARSTTGWVRHDDCMINLPDVIPSIIYDNTNAYSSEFRTSGVPLPDVTGRRLYSSMFYNFRLQRWEFAVPAMYSTARRIAAAQRSALENGDTLVIYEAWRPYDTQVMVYDAMKELSDTNEHVRKGLSGGSWGVGWFIASGVSSHQRGCAMDVSLAKVINYQTKETGRFRYTDITEYEVYEMLTPIHELSVDAVIFAYPVETTYTGWIGVPLSPRMEANKPAQTLQKYVTDAGFSPLASEWWHFDDLYTHYRIFNSGSFGNYELAEIVSAPPY
jgi:D-alanyl-D-alanine dipeptidase